MRPVASPRSPAAPRKRRLTLSEPQARIHLQRSMIGRRRRLCPLPTPMPKRKPTTCIKGQPKLVSRNIPSPCRVRAPWRSRCLQDTRSTRIPTLRSSYAGFHPSSLPMRAWRSWGLCRVRQLLDFHVGVPALEHGTQFVVECLDSRLQQQMRPAFAPLHLLFLAKSFAHHLVHRGLHEPCGYCLAVTIPLAIIWNEVAVVGDVGAELLHGFEELLELGIGLFEIVNQ